MSSPRILLVPGGTSPGAVAMAYASLHKLVELHEERALDPDHPAPHTVVVLRDPASVDRSTLRTSATTPTQAFP
ncbi:MAG: acyl-CoA synthetase, partial [Propionibacterium sp.]|nr:acyl-CoA synthetase [Propionibacterium sp.]